MNEVTFGAFGDELTKIAEYAVVSPANMDPEVGARHGTIGGAIGGGLIGGYTGAGLGAALGRHPATAALGGLGGMAAGAGLGALGGRALGRYNAKLEGEKYTGNIKAKERLLKQLQAEKKLDKLRQRAGE